ncbi:MAG TPA: hypothetical protein VHT52_11635 [Stellaceae bacterium]|nr:hypothetical protein [Stellaceae bacterium]
MEGSGGNPGPFLFVTRRSLYCRVAACYKLVMRALRRLSARPELIVDQQGVQLADPFGYVVGVPGPFAPFSGARVVYAMPTNIGGGLIRRYTPSHPPGETAIFGMDFSEVIPLGAAIAQQDAGIPELGNRLLIYTNLVPPTPADGDWNWNGQLLVRGRALYATLSGGVLGTDYQLRWTAVDTLGNVWPRTGLCLCATTS